MELKPNKNYDHAFAIVRFDTYQDSTALPQNKIMVIKVVLSQEFAEQEVTRLSELNHEKGSIYFWQVTRLERAIA
jgi:ABC-type lipoprotein release transport system permease subunit